MSSLISHDDTFLQGLAAALVPGYQSSELVRPLQSHMTIRFCNGWPHHLLQVTRALNSCGLYPWCHTYALILLFTATSDYLAMMSDRGVECDIYFRILDTHSGDHATIFHRLLHWTVLPGAPSLTQNVDAAVGLQPFP